VTTIVRPSEADLSAIARRIAGPLSPEGAENWYRNDSAILLQEIATLRKEIAALRRDAELARQSFYQDGAQAEMDDSLYIWALAWKDSATGFWQKAQTKTLREQLATQKITVAALKDSLAAVDNLNRAQAVDMSALAAELAELRQTNETFEQTHEEERSRFLRRIGELESELNQARAEVTQMRSDFSRDVEALKVENEARLARSRELLDRAMESL
jgi:DNA repair exonuclease SbcCD ATPase subunit